MNGHCTHITPRIGRHGFCADCFPEMPGEFDPRAVDTAGMTPTAPACEWREDEDGIYETTCGNAFEFTAFCPTNHGFAFCPYCGLPLQEVPYADDTGRD